MENCDVLLRVYNDFVNKNLDVNNIEDKIIIQKIVFLLGELGVKIGNYKFVLDKFGPFSQSLHNEITLITENNSPFTGTFSEQVMEVMTYLKQLLDKQEETSYNLREWLEVVATFLFLKQYMYPSFEWDSINTIVMDIKKHLNDKQSNEQAIYYCQELLNYRT